MSHQELSRELLKSRVAKEIGERVYLARDISYLIKNLGGDLAFATIKQHLRDSAVSPRHIGINPVEWGYDSSNVFVYPESAVWNYLQQLDQRGKVILGSLTFEDLIEREWHLGQS